MIKQGPGRAQGFWDRQGTARDTDSVTKPILEMGGSRRKREGGTLAEGTACAKALRQEAKSMPGTSSCVLRGEQGRTPRGESYYWKPSVAGPLPPLLSLHAPLDG